MGSFLALFSQMLFFSVGPLLLLGLVMWFLRQVFAQLVGTREGRPFLLSCFAPSTPLREAAHVAMAVLFWHRVEDARFLNLSAESGELGYVEHSYHPRNPVALLGNFFYALGPVILGLAAVLAISMLCFGGVTEQFFLELSALEGKGSVADYLRVGAGLLPTMFLSTTVSIGAKILGALLLLLLCMGVFVSFRELLEGLVGAAIYAGIVFVCALVMALLDGRVQRYVLDGMRSFATGVLALYLPVLAAAAMLLIIAVIFFVIRKLAAVPETGSAVVPYRENGRKY